MDGDGREGSPRANPNLGDAERLEADLRTYYARKRSMVIASAIVAVVIGLGLIGVSVVASLSVVVGAACGLVNAFLAMRSNERLVEHRSVASFVFSSVLRIFVFGIVPVEFCTHGPWWTLGTYFVGFFTPLTLYAIGVARDLRTS